MKYVIAGVGAAGITAAKTLRKGRPDDEIVMVSWDRQVHSRCMLHKFLSHERDAKGLNFAGEDFFEKNRISWIPGVKVEKILPEKKEILLSDGENIAYDKLLLATGANSFIPPVGHLREASNVFGLRHLHDAQAIDAQAEKAENIVIIGSGLVGLDAAYGLMEKGKKVSIVEMAGQILPVQLDEKAAFEYQKRFEKAGAAFYLNRKGQDTRMDASGNVTSLCLDDGTELPCDLIIVAAGVRSAVEGLECDGFTIDRGLRVNDRMETGVEDIYAAGDLTGLSGIWPNAMKQGEIAAINMMGGSLEYEDHFAMKNTINFFGLLSLCVGQIRAEEGDVVIAREDSRNYKRVLIRDGKVVGMILQGDISHAGIWQYMIKNEIPITGIEKDIFDLNFSDFYGIRENGEYSWKTV